MWFPSRYWYHIRTHKKKSILFALLGFLDWYYDIHSKVWKKIRSESLYTRLTKNIRKELYPPSHLVCVEPSSDLPLAVHKDLTEYFLNTDFEILRGIRRSHLGDIAVSQSWFTEKDKFLGSFYSASGYRQFKNQRKSNMKIHEFIGFFNEMYKRDPSLDMEHVKNVFIQENTTNVETAKENDLAWVRKFKEQSKEHVERLKNVFKVSTNTEETKLDLLEKELEVLYIKHEQAMSKQDIKEASSLLDQIKELEKERSLAYTGN